MRNNFKIEHTLIQTHNLVPHLNSAYSFNPKISNLIKIKFQDSTLQSSNVKFFLNF